MRTAIFLPPLRRTSGGLRVLLDLAETLHAAGRDAFLVARDNGEPLEHGAQAPIRPWDDIELHPEDLWIVPEGWVNALALGLNAKARCVVYCQNQAYLFSAMPPGVSWRQLPVTMLAVSHPVAHFIEQILGSRPPILRPALMAPFVAPFRDKLAAPPVRIAYMPRKNKALIEQTRHALHERLSLSGLEDRVAWVEIKDEPPEGVARLLDESHIFFAAGFPEGIGLPPLEAMARGCLAVGFAGFGGWDYMRQALPGGAGPGFALDTTFIAEEKGNAFVVPDGDTLAGALALERGVGLWMNADADATLARLLDNARDTAALYHPRFSRERAFHVLDGLASTDQG